MKTPIITTMLLGLTVAWSASAQQSFQNLDSHMVDKNLQQYVKQQQTDQWFAYSIPAAESTASMCCFNLGKQAVCDLNQTQNGFGSSSQSPNTDNIHVFVHLKKGKVNRIMPIGDHCEVKAEGLSVDWLKQVSEQQSIEWLKEQVGAHSNKGETDGLYVLSLHQAKQAAIALSDLAKDNEGEYSEQAVFWLGQRQQDGFSYLKTLYEDMPTGVVRRKVNFALSQNNNKQAVSLLKKIAQHDQDDEQQADAIFWLSQIDEVADLPRFLTTIMSTSDDDEIKDKAIFSLSQINNDEANQELLKLVKNHKDAKVREKALFWLAQNSPKLAKKAALSLLKLDPNEGEQENAVFVLSQLPAEESAEALFNIVRGNYPINIKKKAIFWLSQSDDAKTIDKLEELL